MRAANRHAMRSWGPWMKRPRIVLRVPCLPAANAAELAARIEAQRILSPIFGIARRKCRPIPTPVGSHPGAAGEVASSAPASPHSSAFSSVAPSHPLEATGAAAAIHGGGPGVPVSVAASSPAAESAGAPPSRVGRPGVSITHVVDTETGWVRATRLEDGGWYLSMKHMGWTGCTFLAAADIRHLFSREFNP